MELIYSDPEANANAFKDIVVLPKIGGYSRRTGDQCDACQGGDLRILCGSALYFNGSLNEIGLFYEEFFPHMEDAGMAILARFAGWKRTFVPEARLHHHVCTAASVLSGSLLWDRNTLGYMLKAYPVRLLITSLPWIVGMNLAVIPPIPLIGQGRVILRSEADAVKEAPRLLGKGTRS